MRKIVNFLGKNYKIIVILFFLIFLLIGLFIYKDYGISVDEAVVRAKGYETIYYVSKGEPELLTSQDRFYGPFYDVSLVLIERAFHLSENLQEVYFTRHLVNFLLFYLSVIAFYFLCKKSFKSWKVGLLGSTFLILSPRIFADSFYNPKDIPFMSLFIISILTLVLFLEKKTVLRAIIHALATAACIDIRILGILVPCLTVIFYITDLLIQKETAIKDKRAIGNFFIHIFLLAAFVILFWPYLWSDPLGHLIESFKYMSKFPWNDDVLLMGYYIHPATNTPWYYTLVLILVTTPILYTAFFIAGIYSSIKNFTKNPLGYYSERKGTLISILWFSMPLLVVIILKAVLYSSWRQMFFIYPAFILISLEGLVFLYNYINDKFRGKILKTINIILVVVIISSFINTAYFMIRNHPFQNIYFNIIAGKNMDEAKYDFDLDSWGLTYKKALEYIAQNDSSRVIRFYVQIRPGDEDIILLPAKYRRRLLSVEDINEATYIIANYHNHRADFPLNSEFYSVTINGTKVVTIYKVK
jgi:hypothetical protein